MGLSPMMSHYLETKQKHPDCVLFYRLGDFYEMFFEDAEKVSKLLDLTLTGRDCGLENRAPMCGIPFHAADTYIAKLVALGEKVAICEQLEEAVKGKMVERDVIKIVTAGTITENSLLDEKSNNYLLSVFQVDNNFAISWTDITTGEFNAKSFKNVTDYSVVIDTIIRISPSEIIGNEFAHKNLSVKPEFARNVLPRIYLYKEHAFNSAFAYKTLTKQFAVANLNCFGIEEEKGIISACGALIEYLNETQKHSISSITKINVEEDNDFMMLDATAMRNLEITKTMRDGKRYGSLLWLLDNTLTSMGSRKLNSWLTTPLLDVDKINYRQNGVEELFSNPLLRNGIREVLGTLRDIERLAGKISNNNITPKECRLLGESLSQLPSLKFSLAGASSKILRDISNSISDFNDISTLILHAIKEDVSSVNKDGGYISDGFDKELDRLRSLSQNSKTTLDQIEQREKEETGIKTLKIGFNKVFGYYIEVSNSFKDKVPYSYIRKQTLVGGERYITEELKILEEEILTSKEKAIKLESEIFGKIKMVLSENIVEILKSSNAVSALDVLASLAHLAKKNNYVKPNMLPYGEELNLVASRHPVIEQISQEQFIPNDSVMNTTSDRMLIITGPNMAGKSTYMRQIALIVIMAHIGSFVPCKKANIPLTDKVFTRVGANDNLIFDQSTFMVEMNEVSVILNKATKNSLLILDEVGRGTSTYDGLSIAWAVVEYIADAIKAKTLFATHYHELSELEGKIDGVKNYKVTVKEFNGSVLFLRKIVEGSANKSFGIEVASLAGVPKVVTDKAKGILKKLEKKDLNSSLTATSEEDNQTNDLISEIISSTDIDMLSPREALDLLYKLKSYVKEK